MPRLPSGSAWLATLVTGAAAAAHCWLLRDGYDRTFCTQGNGKYRSWLSGLREVVAEIRQRNRPRWRTLADFRDVPPRLGLDSVDRIGRGGPLHLFRRLSRGCRIYWDGSGWCLIGARAVEQGSRNSLNWNTQRNKALPSPPKTNDSADPSSDGILPPSLHEGFSNQ